MSKPRRITFYVLLPYETGSNLQVSVSIPFMTVAGYIAIPARTETVIHADYVTTSMAEFVLVPPRDIPPDRENRTALLFFCKHMLAEEQGDLKAKFDFITKELSQNPVFVLDRSQTFEHKQSRTEDGIHRLERQQMLKELELFLPPELRAKVKKDATEMLRLEDGIESQPSDIATDTKQSPARYIQYEKAPGQPSRQHLAACFIHLPSWDTLEVHHLSLNVSPKTIKSWKPFANKVETLEIDGRRSIMQYSMITSTAKQVVSQQDTDVENETNDFYESISKYQLPSLPTPNADDSSGATAALPQEPTKRGWWFLPGFCNKQNKTREEGRQQPELTGKVESSVDPANKQWEKPNQMDEN